MGRLEPQDAQRLEESLRQIADHCRLWLSAAQITEFLSFVEAGEYGVAFELLCDWLGDIRSPLPELVVSEIERLGTKMEIAARYWEQLRSRSPYR